MKEKSGADKTSADAYRSKIFKGRSVTNRPSIQYSDEPGDSRKATEYINELGDTVLNTKDVIIPTLITPTGKATRTKLKIHKSLFRKHAFNPNQTKITSLASQSPSVKGTRKQNTDRVGHKKAKTSPEAKRKVPNTDIKNIIDDPW